MGKIRQILADNMKVYRRKRGFSQVKLAEQANVSAQYIAMIEMCNKFPKPEMLERLAEALGIEPQDFFTVSPTPQNELERLRFEIKQDIRQDFRQNITFEVVKTIKDTLLEKSKKQKKAIRLKNSPSPISQ
ncbi:MAG: helix-turn-helix transcriptional regulator [Treponema sp.]|jgi:transcriptional regulator with XRE-family HTH domain|nr:helix-turn-helix transcriptional regulator [Treponema sp.]